MRDTYISVIVPCYNQAQYLDECLQSVLGQTYTNWECIIVNDGSPDNTEEIALRWTQKDSRFKYIYKENGGLSNARNAGISLAKGEFILPLDADDKIGSKYIALGLEAFNRNSELKVVYCNAEKFGEETGQWALKSFSLKNLAFGNVIFCSAIFKKNDWELVGGYDSLMHFGWEDWEFWIALLKNGGTVLKLNYVGFFYRVKQNSMVLNMNQNQKDQMYNFLSVKHADFFIKHIGNFHSIRKTTMLACRDKYENKFKSKKFVFNLFTKTFFGIKYFKL